VAELIVNSVPKDHEMFEKVSILEAPVTDKQKKKKDKKKKKADEAGEEVKEEADPAGPS
jgi:hypothetical protein